MGLGDEERLSMKSAAAAAALKLKLAQWAMGNSPARPPFVRIALLFIIQEVEKETQIKALLALSSFDNSRCRPPHTKTDLA